MNTKNLNDIEILKTPHGLDVRNLYDKDSAFINHLLLKPGEALKRHITPVDVCFYVLEGTGIIEIGDEKKEVVADTVIDSPKGIVHCWYNESDSDFRVLIIKAPKPQKKSNFI